MGKRKNTMQNTVLINRRNNRALDCWLVCFVSMIVSFPILSVHSASMIHHRSVTRINPFDTVRCFKLALSSRSFEEEEEEQHSVDEEEKKKEPITAVRPSRIRQKRSRPARRRPDCYWSDINHLRFELCSFWNDHGVHIPPNQPPPIPNEVTLRYYRRHDLRAAVVKYGGREAVAHVLGGSPIVPGRWKDALRESPELRKLVEADATLSTLNPPSLATTRIGVASSSRWKHQDGRKPKGYWNKKTLLKEMYVYHSFVRSVCGFIGMVVSVSYWLCFSFYTMI